MLGANITQARAQRQHTCRSTCRAAPVAQHVPRGGDEGAAATVAPRRRLGPSGRAMLAPHSHAIQMIGPSTPVSRSPHWRAATSLSDGAGVREVEGELKVRPPRFTRQCARDALQGGGSRNPHHEAQPP
jgi:hypothetical protein